MPLRFAPVRRISFMDTSAQTEDAVVERYDLVEVLFFHRLEHDPIVTFKQDRRVRLHVFAHGNALNTAKSFLAFARQNKIDVQLCRIRMRGVLGDRDRVKTHRHGFERNPIEWRAVTASKLEWARHGDEQRMLAGGGELHAK